MPQGGTLSADLLYPDCGCCGAPGGLFVERDDSPSGEWLCWACDGRFETPPDSVWYGVFDLPETSRRVYIDREIRGVPPSEVAQIRGVVAQSVPSVVGKARKRLERARVAAD